VKYHLYNERVENVLSEFDINSISQYNSNNNFTNDSIESVPNLSNIMNIKNDLKHNSNNHLPRMPKGKATPYDSPKKSENFFKKIMNFTLSGSKTAKEDSQTPKIVPLTTNTIRKFGSMLDENELTSSKTKSIRIYPNNTDILEYEIVNLDEDEILEDDSFCQAFYIVGPGKESKIINESEESNGVCRHSDCSILAAMEPELINVYQSNSSLKISPLVIIF
jgi:hypothetical protein